MSLQLHDIGDKNVERLLAEAYRPVGIDPGFVQETQDKLLAAAQELACARQQVVSLTPARPARDYTTVRRRLGWAMGLAAALACVYLVNRASQHQAKTLPTKERDTLAAHRAIIDKLVPARTAIGLTPRPRSAAPAGFGLKVGESLTTRAGEKRRVVLEDGSILYVNGGSEVKHMTARHIELTRGEVYVEVSPRESGSGATFTVDTPNRKVSALGTRFAVQANPKGSGVLVTQGKVQVTGLDRPLTTGEQLITGSTRIGPAPRATHELDWTKDLMAAAESPLVPGAQHCGGALLAIDPFGQEVRLTLRKFHVDVHIEDGFARTTIDQTYFNNETWRLEGTFYFPLPPDASLSRLAMYVEDGDSSKLNEGGMAERQHANNVYRTIVEQRRDPALLEWVDGSTFKMRVFPLEGRKEKRIILSYTQRIPSLYGITQYRFPTGHSMQLVNDWSFEARVKHGAELRITSPSHPDDMQVTPKGGDMVLTASAKNAKPEKDVVVEILDGKEDRDQARYSRAVHENFEYLMLRYRPELKTEGRIERRDWVILFEAAANRDPLLARTQIEVIKNLLENAEHDDTFTLLSANTRVHFFDKNARPLTRKNVDEALAWLDTCHLIGALDLNQAFEMAAPILKAAKNAHLLHVGAGVPALGERRDDELAKRLPEGTRYVGVGVGKKWNRALMKLAAERTGGYFTQINPDESITWRTFDLLSTLNTPRLMNLQVKDAGGKAVFLTESLTLTQGEEVCAITRLDSSKMEQLPKSVIVSGTLDGNPFVRELKVEKEVAGADYLPRTWAKLEIDRLLAADSEANKEAITKLSMQMYVMSPFTSLLVLETEEDYKNFKVDRGRKDHWALYACPDRIPTVFEPDPARQAWLMPKALDGLKPKEQVLSTILVRPAPRFLHLPGRDDGRGMPHHFSAFELYRGMYAVTEMDEMWMEQDRDRLLVRLGEIDLSMKELEDRIPQFERSFPSRDDLKPGRAGRLSFLGNKLGFKERDATRGAKEGEIMKERFIRLPRFNEVMAREEQQNALDGLIEVDGRWSGKLTLRDLRIPLGQPRSELDFMPRGESMDELKRLAKRPLRLGGEGKARLTGNDLFEVHRGQGLEFGRPLKIGNKDKDLDQLFFVDEATRNQRKLYIDYFAARVTRSSPGQHLIFSAPRFHEDYRLFGDLTLYAPGLRTKWEDIESTLEREAKQEKIAPLGKVDEGARRLIDAARSAGWETVTIDDGHGRPFQVTFNGQGHFEYARFLANGMREHVMADAEHLWHVYREMGLASRRPNGRAYFDEISNLAPWLLPPVEDLARWTDVRLIGKNVVALVPRTIEKEDQAEVKTSFQMRLVFSSGRLAERQLVEMPAERIVMRETYDSEGKVKLLDAGDFVLSEYRLGRTVAAEPKLNPDTGDLLVIRFPVRTMAHLYEIQGPNRAPYAKLSKALAEDMFISECWENNGWRALDLFAQRFHSGGDARLGFYVLLNSARINIPTRPQPIRDGLSVTYDMAKEHPDHPVAGYLAYNQRVLHGETPPNTIGTLPGEKDSFVNRLARCRDLVSIWRNNQVGTADTQEFALNSARTIQELETISEPLWAWALVDAVVRNGRSNSAFNLALARIQRELGEDTGLIYSGRYQHASRLLSGGNHTEAKKIFLSLYDEAFNHGVIPPIDGSFRTALNEKTPEGTAPFAQFMREKHAQLLKERRPLIALQLTWQAYQIGERGLAGEFFVATINSVKDEDRNLVRLAGLEFLWHTGQYPYADTVLQKVLDDPELGQTAFVWRMAAQFAERRGMLARAVAATEKAMDLEYRELPELINLETVRQDYRGLLGQYHQMATAFTMTETEAPRELIVKVIKTADRWRSLDPDNAEIPERAANILQRLGARELAWDYLTTPIGMKPGEAEPWVQLAQNLREQAEFELADRAYVAAFKMEPTNAQILWDRAQNLQTMGRMDEARVVFAEIASGTWRPSFRWIQDQAKALR